MCGPTAMRADSPQAGPASGAAPVPPGSRPRPAEKVVPPLLPVGSGLRRGRWAGFGVPATVSALANGIDRRQAARRNSTSGGCGGSHMNERSLIRDFLLNSKAFLVTICTRISTLRQGRGASVASRHIKVGVHLNVNTQSTHTHFMTIEEALRPCQSPSHNYFIQPRLVAVGRRACRPAPSQ